MPDPIGSRLVSANAIEFAILECGDRDAPLALCLHGFPDSAHTWRHLLPRLADAGFHAVAPFMRGFAPTSIPQDGTYQTAALGRDANALHDTLGADHRSVIIGHDWGAPVAYAAAVLAPDRWSKVVGMSVPPWGAMGRAFIGNLDQLHRSWYMFFFQHPLADVVVGADDLAFIEWLWRRWSPNLNSDADVRNAKACLSAPDNLQAALGYYRAVFGSGYHDPALADDQSRVTTDQPSQPLLYLHGVDDGCIGIEVARDAAMHAPENGTVHEVPDAAHFLHLEQPGVVNGLICDFLA
jgi:pimeloyl-ACP methyl ester carboxylesterase